MACQGSLKVWFKRFLVRLSNPEKYILDFIQKLSLTHTFFLHNELRNHAAAGAYYMLLSLIPPLVLLLIFIFDTFLDSYPTFHRIYLRFFRYLTTTFRLRCSRNSAYRKKAGGAIGVFGFINLLFSSRLILSSIQRAFGVIFPPADKRRNFLMENVISLGVLPAVFIIVILIGGALSSTKQIIYKYLQINGVSTYYIEPIFNTASYIIPAIIAFFSGLFYI